MFKRRQIVGARPSVVRQGLGSSMVAVGLLGALTLSGCGQKGPLYLPTPPSPSAPADATERAPERPAAPPAR